MTTTTVAPTTLALSKDDLAALREADSVVFESYLRDRERLTQIRAIRNRRTYDDAPVIFTAREQRLFSKPVDRAPDERMRSVPAVVTWNFHGGGDPDHATGFEMIHSAKFSREWVTLVSLLRVGDELILGWHANNSNGYTRQAQLMRDELHLTIRRGQQSLCFLVAVSVCADNTARMVKPNGQH